LILLSHNFKAKHLGAWGHSIVRRDINIKCNTDYNSSSACPIEKGIDIYDLSSIIPLGLSS
jgi:hypothetical protein